jgi:Uma2 family endonuclease
MAETSVVETGPVYHTADMVRALIREDRHWPRYELVHGELLVTPAPRAGHQDVVSYLARMLGNYIERVRPPVHVYTSPADVSWDGDTLVQPDVFVVPVAEAREARVDSWRSVRTLVLVAEVLSPSTAKHDRFTKRRLYQERGVALYWIIDIDAGIVEIWAPEAQFPEYERERLVWHPAGAAEPFTLALVELFRPI